MLARWRAEAERFNVSLSRLVTEIVDDSIRRNPTMPTPREESEMNLRLFKAKAEDLEEQLALAESTITQQKATIKDYEERWARSIPESVDPKTTGRLIEFFTKRRYVTYKDGIVTGSLIVEDGAAREKILASIKFLVASGLIVEEMNGWRWVIEPKVVRVPPPHKHGKKHGHGKMHGRPPTKYGTIIVTPAPGTQSDDVMEEARHAPIE